MINFKEIKEKNENFIANRHIYISNIIKDVFNPKYYKYLCEIGGGNLELAKILAQHYKNIDVYEPLFNNFDNQDNLKLFPFFSNSTDIKNYDLLLSICPYCHGLELTDDYDPEYHTLYLLREIVHKALKYEKDLFLILSNTPIAEVFQNEIINNNIHQIIHDTVNLRYQVANKTKESENKVLILKN